MADDIPTPVEGKVDPLGRKPFIDAPSATEMPQGSTHAVPVGGYPIGERCHK
ncbi:MAG: hypothetical protein R3C68_08280 [Myxococcota bacterium]